jgi:predicted nucleotide-binding protein
LTEFFFDLLRRVGLRPLEFETLVARASSPSPYIGDVVRSGFEFAKACLVLFTDDEIAQLRPELGTDVQGFQPRPNVLFEAGMAIALQRERTVIVEVHSLRGLSDLSGIHTIRFTAGMSSERNNLMSRLKNAGCEMDTSGRAWLDLPFPH